MIQKPNARTEEIRSIAFLMKWIYLKTLLANLRGICFNKEIEPQIGHEGSGGMSRRKEIAFAQEIPEYTSELM